MSDDPFDDLDEYEGREGDPFESLADESDDASPDEENEPADDDADPDPFAHLSGGPGVPDGRDDEAEDTSPADLADTGTDIAGDSADRDPDVADEAADRDVDVAGDPFGDVDISRGDPFESADSAFEQVEVEAADPDEVWARLVGEGEGEDVDETASGTGATTVSTGAVDEEDDVVVVSKHRFCEGCPYFTAPPDVACTHDGTRILAFVGPDDVRISNCPIVAERRELGEVHE